MTPFSVVTAPAMTDLDVWKTKAWRSESVNDILALRLGRQHLARREESVAPACSVSAFVPRFDSIFEDDEEGDDGDEGDEVDDGEDDDGSGGGRTPNPPEVPS